VSQSQSPTIPNDGSMYSHNFLLRVYNHEGIYVCCKLAAGSSTHYTVVGTVETMDDVVAYLQGKDLGDRLKAHS